MSDTSVRELLESAAQAGRPGVLVLDENSVTGFPPPQPDIHIITNRFDIHQQAQASGWHSSFNDFDFDAIAPESLGSACYRISKEKKVVEHVVQSLWSRLQSNGSLHLAGFKNEGIKTFAKRISAAWACSAELTRGNQKLHLYRFVKTAAPDTQLVTPDYPALVHICQWNNMQVWSKPGIFAWDRLDEGSCFLLEHLADALAGRDIPRRGLDLGCGSGLLALALLSAGCSEIMATDNNAAALHATAHNLQLNTNSQHWTVQGADAGAGLQFSADLLLCNPPFHQGFAVDSSLTSKFLLAAHRLLSPRGQALFVVNGFIALEKLAAPLFGQVSTLADNRRFKVIRLAR